MSSKRPQFENNEFYHVYNRGVEKRNIFMEISDYYRFTSSLYELNDKNLVLMSEKNRDFTPNGNEPSKKLLVKIIAFCLMPNHYHLILRQLVDGGISLFMKKLSNSYTGYFNEKYKRKGIGALFQGTFKAIHVENDKQLISLINYIFTNPIKLIEKDWKEKGVKNEDEIIRFLKSYKWSSFLDCIEVENFPLITDSNFIIDLFGGSDEVKESVRSWR
jgi:putative transposase